MGQKVYRMPFFLVFHEKMTFLMPIFCQKNFNSLKKHIALMPIFCQKNVSSLKNKVLPCYFFQIFYEKPYAIMPKSAQKKVNSVKTTPSYGLKKSIGSSFFPIFHQKTTLLMPIFCKKMSIHKKTRCSHAHILSKKRTFSQNHSALLSFFTIFSMNPPPPSCPYFVKKIFLP